MARSFPDGVEELIQFARATPPANDKEVVALLLRAFDRPAFEDRIMQESCLPAFRPAIEDSICVLNTGVWKTREDVEIARLPSKNEVSNPAIKQLLDESVSCLRSLRTTFDNAIRQGRIRPCSCNEPDCPVYFMDDRAADELEEAREAVLVRLRRALELA